MRGGANIGPTPMEILGPRDTEAPGPGAGDRGGGGMALRGAAPPIRPPLRAACAPSVGASITATAATKAKAIRAISFPSTGMNLSTLAVVQEACFGSTVMRSLLGCGCAAASGIEVNAEPKQ